VSYASLFLRALSGSASASPFVLAPYLGVVATRSHIPNVSSGTNNYANCRTAHVATEDLTAIQFKYPGWFCPSTESTATAVLNYAIGVEYPSGTFTQALWSGASPGVAPQNGDTGLCDPVAVVIPKGSIFWLRPFVKTATGTGGGIISTQATVSTRWAAQGEACAFSATSLSDLSLGGTITDGGSGAFIYPMCIVATTTKASFFLLGDSRTIGSTSAGGSTAPDSNGNMGQVAQSLGVGYGFINCGVGGSQLSQFNTGGRKRQILGNTYCSHVINGYGINDIRTAGGNRTALQLQGDFTIAAKRFPTKTVIGCTLSPATTGTFTTAGGQTADGNAAARQTFDAWMLTKPAPYKYTVDIAAQTQDTTLTDVWLANYTGDGLHCDAAGYAAIVASGVISGPQLAGLFPLPQFSMLSLNVDPLKSVLWTDFSNPATTPTTGTGLNGCGSGYSWTGSVAPTYGATSFNGGPGYTFNGTTQGLLGDASSLKPFTSGLAGVTLAALYQLTTVPGGSRCIFGATITGSNSERAILGVNSSGFPTMTYRRQDADAATTITSSVALATNTPTLVVGVFDAANNVTTLSLNGTVTATGTFVTSGATTFSATTSNNVTIATLNSLLVAIVAREFDMFDSALSTANRQKVEGDIAWRQGLQASVLPTTHPFYNAPPTS
jgi:hypothetical protein